MPLENSHKARPVAAPSPRRFAIFDLDRTITRKGTYSPFLIFAARRLNPLRLGFAPLVLMAMAGYKLGLMSRTRLKELMQRLVLGGAVETQKVEAIARAFAQRTFTRNIYPEAIAQIEIERAAGAIIIIASAAHRFYLDALCGVLGADHAIGTESRHSGTMLLARIDGTNCYGEEKCRRVSNLIDAWAEGRNGAQVCVYSDDISDSALLSYADEAVATNPSARLARHAMRNGWQIVDWRRGG